MELEVNAPIDIILIRFPDVGVIIVALVVESDAVVLANIFTTLAPGTAGVAAICPSPFSDVAESERTLSQVAPLKAWGKFIV